MTSFFVFLACLFTTYAAYLLATRKSAAKQAQMKQRLADVLVYPGGMAEAEVRLSREELLSEIQSVNRLLSQLPSAVSLKRIIDQADVQLTVMRLLMFSALAGLSGFLAVSMLTPITLIALGAGVLAASFPFLHVWWKRKKRLHKFLSDLPDALELMSRALAAGHAFSESLGLIATEMPDPIATEFRRTYEEQNLGLSLKYALDSLAQRVPLLDLRLCITAVMIQRETGGNLGEILEKVAYTICERFRILEDLKTLTTSSRMSAWVLVAVPIFITCTLTVLNPEYMSVFLSDPRGHKLIAIAIGLQIAGMLMIRKIIRIRV